MGAGSKLRKKIEEMRTYTELMLQLPEIKKRGKVGVFVRIYNCEDANLVIGQSFGSFGDRGCFQESNSSHEKARWLYLHPQAISTTESNGTMGAGGIRGRNYIIGVSGFDVPNYNSALAIVLLTCFEHEPHNGSVRVMREYAKRAHCETELDWLLEHIQTLPVKKKFLTSIADFFSKHFSRR